MCVYVCVCVCMCVCCLCATYTRVLLFASSFDLDLLTSLMTEMKRLKFKLIPCDLTSGNRYEFSGVFFVSSVNRHLVMSLRFFLLTSQHSLTA